MTVEQIIIDKVKILPLDKQQEVLDFVEFLLAKMQISMSKKGKFIDFYLPYSEYGNYISAKSQAQKILQEADTLLKKGSFGVAIIYSANYGQTKTIRKTYAEGKYKTGTSGANQANVMTEMENLLDTPNYQHLQGKIRIAPITTMTNLDFDGKDHITVVKDDLAQIQQMLENGWDILGWQNQTTIKNKNKYAVGGGIAKLPHDISNEIQSTLLSLALKNKKIQIASKEDYPNAKWEENPFKIGTIGTLDLYYLGKDTVDRDNLVATYYNDETPLEPVDLGSLLKWSQEAITIDKQHEKLLSMNIE